MNDCSPPLTSDPSDFKVLRRIALLVSTPTTSHALGQYLVKHGLRQKNGSPTLKADREVWAISYQLCCGRTAYKWNYKKILDLCSVYPPPMKGTRKP